MFNHCVKTYQHMHETVAPSSGTSEFYGIAKAATTVLGMKGFIEDLGVEVGVQANVTWTCVLRRALLQEEVLDESTHRSAEALGSGQGGDRREGEWREQRGAWLDEARGETQDGVVH